MAAMGRTGTTELSYKEGICELVLKREPDGRYALGDHSSERLDNQFTSPYGSHNANEVLSRAGDTLARVAAPAPEVSKEEANAVYITSPMVGTFYSAPSPEDPTFVKVGDKIEKNQVVCVIEAMKVMNEIKANVTGALVEVLVESGQPVEFGTKLFRIV